MRSRSSGSSLWQRRRATSPPAARCGAFRRCRRCVRRLRLERPAARRGASAAAAAPRVLSLVLWPAALVTLAVTLLRLVGELRGWTPEYFSRLPGGGLAIVGITWLVPFVGAYFGWRLTRARRPVSRSGDGRRLVDAGSLLLGLAIGYGLERAGAALLDGHPRPVGGCRRARRDDVLRHLARARLAAARLCRRGPHSGRDHHGARHLDRWGTHYDAPPPGLPALFPMARWLWTGLLPQATIWVAFTLAVGMVVAPQASGSPRAARADAPGLQPGL